MAARLALRLRSCVIQELVKTSFMAKMLASSAAVAKSRSQDQVLPFAQSSGAARDIKTLQSSIMILELSFPVTYSAMSFDKESAYATIARARPQT